MRRGASGVVAFSPNDVPTGGALAPLPEWFHRLDTDGDGQIGLYEWQASGRPLEEFQRMDRNRDGLLTANEVQRYLTRTQGQPSPGVTVQASSAPVGSWGSSGNGFRPPQYPILGFSGLPPRTVPSARPNRPTPGTPGSPAAPAPAPPPHPSTPRLPSPPPPIPNVLATTPLPLNDESSAYWLTRLEQIKARIQQGRANVVFLGDSITDGLQRVPVWPAFFDPLGAADFAVAGITTSQVLWQVQTGQVAAVAPDVVVVLIGTNNLGLGQSPADTAAGVAAVVSQIQTQLPKTRILLLGLLPRGQSPADPFRPLIAAVNRRIARLADGQAVRYLNMGQAFLQRDGTIAPEVMADFLHPTPFGYIIYTTAIWQPLMAALKGD
jgi:lysophospholipase L1-like esterase